MTNQELGVVCTQLLGPRFSPVMPVLPNMDAFPPKMRDMIYFISHQRQASLELSIANALGTVAVASMGQIEVEIPTGSTVASNIGLIACAESGERKSSVQEIFKRPCTIWETEQMTADKNVYLEQQANRKTLVRELKRIERQLQCEREETSRTALLDKANEIGMLLDAPQTPGCSRIFMAHNLTGQAFIRTLHSNGGVGSIYTDEGDLTDLLKNKGLAEMFRQGLSGGSISATRVNLDLHVPVCRFSYVCTTQYTVLKNLGRLADQNEYGSIARLWFILGPTVKGNRNKTQFNQPDKSSCGVQWDAQITSVLHRAKSLRANRTPWLLQMDAKTQRHWESYCCDIDNRIASGELWSISPWASKAAGGVLRLAAILYFFDNPTLDQKALGLDYLNSAITIYNWLIEHAKVAYLLMFPQVGQKEVYKLLRHILWTGLTRFSAGQLINRLKLNTEKTSDWYAGLQILVDLGYMQNTELNPYGLGRGRPKKEFMATLLLTQGVNYELVNLRTRGV